MGRDTVSRNRIACRSLGRAGLRISELGLGGAGLGNLYEAVSEETVDATVSAAWEAGIRYVDTAPYYGFGLSEQRLGRLVRAQAASAEPWVVSTKVGRRLVPCEQQGLRRERDGFVDGLPFAPVFDYSHDGILRSVEDSLQRMGLARVDILLVHDIGRMTHGDAQAAQARAFWQGGYAALVRLRDEGTVKAIGLGVNECQVCVDFIARGDFDCLLLAGRYTLLEQGALTQLLPACAQRGIKLILGGIYNSGILASGVLAGGPMRYNYEPAPADIIRRVARMEHICAAHGVPLAAAALQFVLAHPQVASVIPGATSTMQVARNLAYYRTRIPPALWSDLKQDGLVDAAAPVPAVSMVSPHED